MKKYIDTIEDKAALYREALRMACEYFQETLMGCPNEEDYELADNETHNCYACKYFANFSDERLSEEDAFTEKAVECYMKAFILRAQKKREKELADMEEWGRLSKNSAAIES